MKPPKCSSFYDSTAYEASSVVKGSDGVVYGVKVYNSSSEDLVFQLHNTTSVPADTAVPTDSTIVPALSQVFVDFGEDGRYMNTGITWCGSSTFDDKTISGSVMWVNIKFD